MNLLAYLQPQFDRYICKMVDPRSKGTTPEQKKRIKDKLIEKGSLVFVRRKERWRQQREERSLRKEDNKA